MPSGPGPYATGPYTTGPGAAPGQANRSPYPAPPGPPGTPSYGGPAAQGTPFTGAPSYGGPAAAGAAGGPAAPGAPSYGGAPAPAGSTGGPAAPGAPSYGGPAAPGTPSYGAPAASAPGAHPLPPEAPAPSGRRGRRPGPAAAITPVTGPPVAPAPAPAPGATGPGNGYSTPKTTGNARVTDAQRARAEGRSPIIPPGIQPAGLTALLGLLLAGGAALGPYGLLVPLVLLQAVTAAGWFRLNGMWPARQGIALAFAGGLAADAVLLAVGREHGPAAILGTLGVWVLITVVLQLRSHAAPDERMYGLMATVAAAAFAVLAAGHLAASADAVVVGGIAVAVAVVARALPVPPVASVVLALLAAAGAGVAAGGLTDLGAGGALLGLAAGGLALVGLRVASYDYPSRFVHFTAGVALPLTLASPAVYLIGRVLA
ncbi:hypothetical protein ACWDR0_11410 [Streptomyces sp. NPDC003691]